MLRAPLTRPKDHSVSYFLKACKTVFFRAPYARFCEALLRNHHFNLASKVAQNAFPYSIMYF